MSPARGIGSRSWLSGFLLGCLVTAGVGAGMFVGRDRVREAVTPAPRPVLDHDVTQWLEPDRARLAERHPFLDLSRWEAGEIGVPAGSHDLKETLVLPRGMRVRIEPGAALRLAPGASFIAYGPVEALGQTAAIRFERLEPERPFGVVGVLAEEGASHFRSVSVIGGSQTSVNGVLLSGALSIRGGEVLIEACRFADNTGDDGLNLQGARGRIEGSEFVGNAADGLDLDASRAEIVGNRFERNRKDAIDTGGSIAIVRQNVLWASRRCLALGEGSRVELRANEFRECGLNVYADATSLVDVVATD